MSFVFNATEYHFLDQFFFTLFLKSSLWPDLFNFFFRIFSSGSLIFFKSHP